MKISYTFMRALTPLAAGLSLVGCGSQSSEQKNGRYDIEWAKGDEPVSPGRPYTPPSDSASPADEAPAPPVTPTNDADGAAINRTFRGEAIAFMRANGSWGATECFRFLTPYANGRDTDRNANCPGPGNYQSFNIVTGDRVTGDLFRINGDLPQGWDNAPPEVSLHARRFLGAAHELGHHLTVLAGYRYNSEEAELAADLFALAMLRKRHPQDAAIVERWYIDVVRNAMALNPNDEHGLILSVSLSQLHARVGDSNDIASVFRQTSRHMTAIGYDRPRSNTRYSASLPQ